MSQFNLQTQTKSKAKCLKGLFALLLSLLLTTSVACSSDTNYLDEASSGAQTEETSSSSSSDSESDSAEETDDLTENSSDETETNSSSASKSASSSASKSTTSSSSSSVAKSSSNTATSLKNGIPNTLKGSWESQSDGLYYTCDSDPSFSKALKKKRTSFEDYSALDSLGRCQAATALIGLDIMPTEGRGSISEVKPTGWHTYEYDFINGGYLYNRCHLIAYSLAGENANERNLITGTRQMNEAMIMFEDIVYTYVTGTGKQCLYRVTPIFLNDDLVARGVHMEAYSVEDNGNRVKFNVYIPNKQDKVKINYATGESSAKSSASSSSSKSNSSSSGKTTYVLNTSSKKFHYPDCSAVKRMADHNKKVVKKSRSSIIKDGYDPCGICNP